MQNRRRSGSRMSVASAVSRGRGGPTLLHSLVPMHRPGGTAAVLSAKAKDFRGGCNGERGEIASSTSGGRGIYEHSPKAKRPILTDKSPHYEKTLLSMLSNAEKENDCNGKNNQNDAAVRRLINAGTLGVRLLLTLCCAVNRQRINGCGVCLDRLIYRRFVGD